MSNCTSGCATQDHSTYAECLRSKGVTPMAIAPNHDHGTMKQLDKDLIAYKRARDAGLQPTRTTSRAAELAWKTSDAMGQPFDGGKGVHQLAQKLVAQDGQ